MSRTKKHPPKTKSSKELEGANKDYTWTVIRFAIASRVVTIFLLELAATFGSEYDSSSSLITIDDYSCADPFNKLVFPWLMPFVRWDAVYNLDIAMSGYRFEQQHAFFPGYPFVIQKLSLILNHSHWLCDTYAIVVAGVLVSNVSFILAAACLYRLSRALGLRPALSFNAALFFCISPASVFMSSLYFLLSSYTESLFALLTFLGMWALAKERILVSGGFFAAAACTRPNGILYAGFFIWNQLFTGALSPFVRVKLVVAMLMTITPLVLLQYTGYITYCGFIDSPSWCDSKLPVIYSHVQEYYWDNGFLKYYTLQQLPNFVLAAPLFTVILSGICAYAARDTALFFSLGLTRSTKKATGFYSDNILPYVYLSSCMLVLVTLMMHVQVITRFYTSSPFVFWYLASELERSASGWNISRIYIRYCLCFGAVGISLFACFLPPA